MSTIQSRLAPLDFHQFGLMKEGLYEKYFAADDAVIVAISK
jgi:hypothetical protein